MYFMPQDIQQLLAHGSSIASNLASLGNLSNIVSRLDHISGGLTTASLNLSRIATVLEELKVEHDADRAEQARSGRDGEWQTEWFVEVPPRKPVKFDDEKSAYEGARHAAEGLAPGTEIKVFCTEIKRYQANQIPRQEWDSREK